MGVKSNKQNTMAVTEWRRRAKRRLIEAFGGCCGVCGYNRCEWNLAFHHLDPGVKEKGFGHYQSLAWAKIVAEIRKCVMLCHNCHGEVHARLIVDLSDCRRFDEKYSVYSRALSGMREGASVVIVANPQKPCLRCGRPLIKQQRKFCSWECAHASRREASQVDVIKLVDLLQTGSCEQAAAEFGVTGKTIRRWAHRFGVDLPGWKWRTGGESNTLRID